MPKPKRMLAALSLVIAVVDDGGTLITMRRPDDAQVAGVQVSIDKAHTAAISRAVMLMGGRCKPRRLPTSTVFD
jgi:uncharacterized protein GlcG (DUF336 family)